MPTTKDKTTPWTPQVGELVQCNCKPGTVIFAEPGQYVRVLHGGGDHAGRDYDLHTDQVLPLPMWRRENPELVVLTSGSGYWAKGSSIENALKQLREAGARGLQQCAIYLCSGSKEDLAEVTVDDTGSIHYPQTVTFNRVGYTKINVNQR